MTRIYPEIKVESPKNPARLYAIPVFGFVLKMFMLLPIMLELIFVGLILYFILIVNSLYVLFYGKYWDVAYSLSLGFSNLFAKSLLFFDGVTDKYPGFKLEGGKLLFIDKPKNPNRLFALPLIGGIIRALILIPYFIYSQIISYAAWFGTLYAVKPVLLKKKYPQLTYEIVLDSTRICLASFLYLGGLSDKYPSFKISMNHKTEKIILLILGTILFLLSNADSSPR